MRRFYVGRAVGGSFYRFAFGVLFMSTRTSCITFGWSVFRPQELLLFLLLFPLLLLLLLLLLVVGVVVVVVVAGLLQMIFWRD